MTASPFRPAPTRPTSTRLSALAAATLAATLVVACGKDPGPSVADRFVAGIQSQPSGVRALAARADASSAAAAPTVTPDQVFAWAEISFPELFAGAPAGFADVAYQGKVFSGRAYANGTYLAVANGEAYGLGPYTGQALVNHGAIQGYATLVCGRIDCGTGSGTLNACTQSADDAWRTGARIVAQYVASTPATGASSEYSLETVVDGSAGFAGTTAVQVTRTRRDAAGNVVTDGVDRFYVLPTPSGQTRLLGSETGAAGSTRTTRVVYDQPVYDTEFTLQAGQSVGKVVNATTTVLVNGVAQSTTAVKGTRVHGFEARETVTVQGRSYDTCRYREQQAGAPATLSWHIVGTGVVVRSESRDASGAVLQRSELRSGSINGAPLSGGQSTLDAASAERFVNDFSYVLPICSPSGSGKLINGQAGVWLRRAREVQQLSRLAAASRPERRAQAFGPTKPADQVGECGGRLTYTSYVHLDGVTTATRRWDNYCSKDSDTGETQTLNGSWSFVETTVPKGTSRVVSRYEAHAPEGLSIVDRDANGKLLGHQIVTVTGLVNVHGVPGGSPTASQPDRLQTAEWQLRNQLTGKTYRQTGFSVVTFDTTDGGTSMSLAGRIYRTSGYFDLRTTAPILSDSDGNYLSGTLTANALNGDAVVITLVPGETFQGTMTVDGQPVTQAPACVR